MNHKSIRTSATPLVIGLTLILTVALWQWDVRGDIIESRVQVKKGKRRRILLLEYFSAAHNGQERIRHHATRYEERHDKSSGHEGTRFSFG